MSGPAWPYAEVAVDVPLRGGRSVGAGPARNATFHYSIPPQLADRVGPGHLVSVPFGRRRVSGIVVALQATSPVERTREIAAVVEAEPALRPADIALARWMNAHYLAPFYACLQLFLPPGGPGGYERHYLRSEAALETRLLRRLPEEAKRVLALFHGEREISEDRIAAAIPRPGPGIAALEAAGLIRSESKLRPARVQARRLKFVLQQVTDEAAIDAALRKLRPNRRADLLAFLRQPDRVLPSIEEVLAGSGCSNAILKSMAKDGLVAVEEGEERQEEVAGKQRRITIPSSVLPLARGGRLRELEMELRRAGAQAEAVSYLAASGGRCGAGELQRETRIDSRRLAELAAAGLVEIRTEQVWRDPLEERERRAIPPPDLTEDQVRVWEGLREMLGRGAWSPERPKASFASRPRVALLHGVTGSGKTEIYLRAIEHTLFAGRQAIVLVPEIALTPQTVDRFAGRFPGRVGVWHSELSDGERLDTWERARRGLLDVIVGSRSAVFAPLPRLGLIVVDESHADAYKQARSPRYHARDVAIRRAALAGGMVLLGSATPSVESFWEAERGNYKLFELPRRVSTRRSAEVEPQTEPDAAKAVRPSQNEETDALGTAADGPSGSRDGKTVEATPQDSADLAEAAALSSAAPQAAEFGDLPPVEVVDLRAELRAGNSAIFSRALQAALARTLEEGGQAILFLNRRGSATFVLCRDCGHVLACPRCRSPLTHHRQGAALVCHHCNHRQAPPMMCPECGSPRIRYFGAGTEAIEAAAAEAFPEARILRWDADTTGKKGAHEAILARFIDGRADILVGTQMIAKGLDLPRVTLVGVISADTALHFPDFRSAERSFQLLSQVAGRAGRSERGGQVIFQTYAPENPAIQSAAAHDFEGFYRREIAFRQATGYPPFGGLVRLIYVGERNSSAATEARRMAEQLRARIAELGLGEIDLIGPAPAFFGQLRGRARWHILVRGRDPHALLDDMGFGPGWRIDVDPVDLL